LIGLDEEEIAKVHQEGRADEAIRVPLEHSTKGPGQLDQVRRRHLGRRRIGGPLERSLEREARLALR
jgi:hypothetical protein